MKIYDEDEAVAFIKNAISDKSVSSDDILEVIDAIFDFYDENGDLDLDFDDEDLTDDENTTDSLVASVTEALADSRMSANLVREIIKAELAYEDSLL